MRWRSLVVLSACACGAHGHGFGSDGDAATDVGVALTDGGVVFGGDTTIIGADGATKNPFFPLVSGVYVASPPDAPAVLLTNAAVAGAVLDVDWADFDLGDATTGAHTTYDFSSLDAAMAPWLLANRRVNLTLRAATDKQGCAGNCATPAWVSTALASTNRAVCNGVEVPNFRASVFRDAYELAIEALVSHVAADPRVGVISVGLGMGRGSGLPAGWDDTSALCGETFTSTWGYTVGGTASSTWTAYILSMIQFVGLVPPPTKTFVVGLDAIGSNDVPDYVGSVAAIYNVGLRAEGFVASDLTTAPCTDDWCSVFDQHHLQAPVALRLGAHTPDELPSMLPFAIQHHVNALEIDYADWMIAYDPNDPNFATYGASYRQAIEAAAASL
jgi:hypothetical protein